jgi:ceramide glucosyltransferase
MTAGAAQILLKSAGLVASGRVVLAGTGPLLWLLVCRTPLALAFACVAFLVRILLARNLQYRLTHAGAPLSWLWLVPMKDLLQAALWLTAYAGNTVEWRGRRLRLRRDGTLVRD